MNRLIIFCSVCCALLCLTLTPHALAGEGDKTLRERIKEHRADAQPGEGERNSSTKITRPGDYERSLQHDGISRRYRIHVPRGYKPTQSAPLVLAFHGGGGDMDYMAQDKYYGLIAKSDATGFVVVFPNGYSKFRSGKFATWNAGACCANARDKNIDDVGFVRKMIAQVAAELNINRARIYATGMSNGGMMSYRLACEMSDTFAAIAAVAGTDNTLNCTPRKPVAILHIHAANDDRVLFNGGAGDKFRDESKVTDFASVPATIAKWVKYNKCVAQSQRLLEKPGAYCEQYSRCAGNVQVQLCVTETGGHSWPGGSKPRGDEPPSQAIVANDIIWDFFSQ